MKRSLELQQHGQPSADGDRHLLDSNHQVSTDTEHQQ